MSEYQCYEFIAFDRPLTAKQMAELRAVSTRADISQTRFWNDYQWGDLKADPEVLLERYFDAHLYFSNGGIRRLMLRVPRARIDTKALNVFFAGRPRSVCSRLRGEFVLIDLRSDTEEPEDDERPRGSLAALSSLRTELLHGDFRVAYLAWLLAVQQGDLADHMTEPPVPLGLATLSAAQRALVEFLRLDDDLLAAAAHGSSRLDSDNAAFQRWARRLSPTQQQAWFLRAVEEPELSLGRELLRAFRAESAPRISSPRRTVRELRERARALRAQREAVQTAREQKAQAAAEKRRQRGLDQLGRQGSAAWTRLEALVVARAYDDALRLAVDLRDLARREGDSHDFLKQFATLHQRQARRRGFFNRWNRQ